MKANARCAALGFAFVLLTTAGAAAQTPAPGSPWASWSGCWRLVTETGAITPGDAQPRVCVTEVPGGARLTTTVGDKPAVEQTILTDGVDHPVDEAGCTGTQRAEWSPRGLRLYARADLTCAGDPAPRRVSGYALLAQDGTWLDIQAVEMASRDTVRVRRYRRVDAEVAARVPPGRSLSIEDIKEASGKVSSAALEAAVVETDAAIPLSARTLIDLDRAGVSDRVIDLMVAITYPEKFVIERSTRADRGSLAPMFINDPFSFGYFGYPMWSGAYGLYDYYSPYYYTPFGYSYYGRLDPRLVGGGLLVVTDPGGGSVPVQPSGTARAVDGLGYTRVRPRDPVQAERAPGTASRVGTSSTSSSSSSSGSSSGSSGTASPSGFSSGGGGGDSGRTAVPR
jgi:uncharacterized membrane protein YgcG